MRFPKNIISRWLFVALVLLAGLAAFAALYSRSWVRATLLLQVALLAALGLAAASFLSFPVAAFFSLAVLSVTLCSGLLSNAVSEGTLGGYNPEKGTAGRLPIDVVAIPFFRGVLYVVNMIKGFSPIDSLSTGRTITWSQLALAFGEVILLLGGVISLGGILIFNRRELATAQGTQ